MRRVLPLLAILVLAPLGARADDKPSPAPIEAERVARLLLSPSAEDQALGQDLLAERMRRGGDVTAFARDVTKALREAGGAEGAADALAKRALAGSPAERIEAFRLLAALGESAVRRLLDLLEVFRGPSPQAVAAPSTPTPEPARVPSSPAPAPPQIADEPEVTSEAAPTGPAWTVTVHAVEAPARGAASLVPDGVVVRTGTAGDAAGWAEAAYRLPDANRLVSFADAPPTATVVGAGVPKDVPLSGLKAEYRKSVTPAKGGGWAVRTGVLRTGYGARVLVTPGPGGLHVDASPRFTAVGRPMPVVRVTPAPDVDPVELDVPEWNTSSTAVAFDLPLEGGSAIVRADGLGADSGKTLLLVLTVAPR
jgi:hypothetical protein